VSIMQGLISLFTTGGKINPFAIALLLFASFYVYSDIQNRAEQREIKRQCAIYQAAYQDKINNLNRVNNETDETIQSIDPDDLTDWVNRINGMQRND